MSTVFLVYYEHVFVYCDVFILTISFLISLLPILKRFDALSYWLNYGWQRLNYGCYWKGGAGIVVLIRFWSFTTQWKMMGFLLFFGWFFIRVLLLDYFTNKYIHLSKKYYKYCWCMQPFLNIMKVVLVYNPNYSSCFPPVWYCKILVFDLVLKWDVETYQMEVMTK